MVLPISCFCSLRSRNGNKDFLLDFWIGKVKKKKREPNNVFSEPWSPEDATHRYKNETDISRRQAFFNPFGIISLFICLLYTRAFKVIVQAY